MILSNNTPKKRSEWPAWLFICLLNILLLLGLGQITTITAQESSGACLSPALRIQNPELKQVISANRSPQEPVKWVQEELANILEHLQSNSPEF